jgi:hypothetical protein
VATLPSKLQADIGVAKQKMKVVLLLPVAIALGGLHQGPADFNS